MVQSTYSKRIDDEIPAPRLSNIAENTSLKVQDDKINWCPKTRPCTISYYIKAPYSFTVQMYQ